MEITEASPANDTKGPVHKGGNQMSTNKRLCFKNLLFIFLLVMAIVLPVSARAATFTKSKPKITKESAYLNGKVYLKWSKISGAKSYEIQRAVIDPSTGKTKSWKAWKKTKKLYVKVKDSGDYKYRVRAVKGSQKSKWSTPKRIFGANAKITDFGYTKPDVFFGVTLHQGTIELRVLVDNKTKSDMGFVPSGTRFGEQSTLYAINSSGKKVAKWDADLDIDFGAVAKKVNAGKKQSLYFTVYGVNEEEWEACKNCSFMISCSFYPNPEVEPLSTQMAFTCTKKASASSLAAK